MRRGREGDALTELLVLAAAVFLHALVSKRLSSTLVTAPMVFVAVGLLTGPDVSGLANLSVEREQIVVLAELTLALVLFSDSVRVDPRLLRRYVGIPARLLGIGLPLTAAVGTVVGRFLLDLGWVQAALVASILSATDAALGQAVLLEPSVPPRIRQSLNVESGLNDGLALPAVTIFTTLSIAESESEGAGEWIWFLVEQIGYGALVGAAIGGLAGWVLVRAVRRGWCDGLNAQLGTIALVGLAYATASLVGGNTFIAAFVTGLVFRAVNGDRTEHLSEFSEDSGQLLAGLAFLVFGNVLLGPAIGDLGWDVIMYAALSLTVVRIVPIFAALAGTHLEWPSRLFLGWFGPRGLASILFGLLVLEEAGTDVSPRVFAAITWTVVLSIVLHGATASWGARRYGRWYRSMTSDEQESMSEGPMHHAEAGPRVRWQGDMP